MGKRYEQRSAAKFFFKRGVRNPFHLSKLAHIPKSTAYRYFARLARDESLEDRPRSGRPPKITSKLRRQLAQVKARNPEENSAFYARSLSKLNRSPVSKRTVQAALKQLDYRWRLVPRKQLTPSQKAARVAFARARLGDTWGRRWSFDEAYFNLYRNANRRWVRCKTGDAASAIAKRKLTAAQEKVSVGIAVAISRGKKSALAFLPRNWKAPDLVEAFDRVIYPSLGWSNRRGYEHELMIDNDGRHQTTVWKQYVDQRKLRPLNPWPANSPDFNSVENAFAWMKWRVEVLAPTSEVTLKEAISQAWEELPLEQTEKLMDSVPRRLALALQLKGGRTKY